MKIHNKIISVLLVFLIVVFGYCVILNASSLTFEKTAILDEGMAYYNVAYEKIRVLTHNDSGGKGNQQISYVKVGKDSLANIVVWTKTGKSALKGANLLDLAADFEKENPGWTVLAGINGDYYDPNTMIPINALVRNGDVIKPHNHMKYFSLGIGNNKEYIVSRNNRTENKYSLSVYNCTGRYIVKEFFLDNQNLPPAIGQTSFYYGNQQEQTIGAARHFVVECNECYNYGGFYCKGTVIDETDKVAVENDRLTIVTRDPAVAALMENKPPVRIQKSLCADNNGYNNIIGVGSEPLKDGSILSFSEIGDQNEAFAQARHPRSSIGFTDEGDVVIAAFDGRQSGIDGVNLREMALAMKSLGCKAAFNLDGGGSTQMIVRKDNVLQFLNSPSETYRRVANAILIVAPDIYVNAAYSDITASGFRLDYHIIPGRLVTVEAVRLLVDGDDYQSSSSPAVLNFSAPYGIHYFSFEVTYRKAGISYTQVFYNNRINIANYNVLPPEKTPPHDFFVEFVPKDEYKGFDAVINFTDPDKTMVKVYLVYDDKKQIAIKDYRGYVCKYYHLSASEDFNFSIEFHYTLSTITPTVEVYPETFAYSYVYNSTENNQDDDDEKTTGCRLFGSPIIFFGIAFYLIRKRWCL